MINFIKKLLKALTLLTAFCMAALTIALIIAGGRDSSPHDNCHGSTGKVQAHTAAKDHITHQLKSPSTAKFSSLLTGGSQVLESHRCQFTVIGYVDAENGFGATVRTRYRANVLVSPDTYSHVVTTLVME